MTLRSLFVLGGPVLTAQLGSELHNLGELIVALKCSGDLFNLVLVFWRDLKAFLQGGDFSFECLDTVLQRR